ITVRLLDSAAASVSRFAPQIRSSASLGVSLFPDHGVEANELIENAEIALYRAKAQGRGRAQVFQPQMRQALTDRIQRMSTFRTLLETGGVKPFYQPQIRLSDRRAHGFEALARWNDPDLGFVSPGVFVPLAEERGFIDALSEA
ncbi:EAL domain-containing protein, partial [Corallococcus exiguus]|nr:EAL domain-containing protein [Corallococcus exiguus]